MFFCNGFTKIQNQGPILEENRIYFRQWAVDVWLFLQIAGLICGCPYPESPTIWGIFKSH